jgi:phospholipid transport system substrate-binding protein
MRSIRLFLAGLMLAAAGQAASDPAPASDAATGQRLLDMLRERDAASRAIARSTAGPLAPADRERLKAIVGDAFDYDELSRQSLGKHWAERTPAERKEFAGLYRRLIEKSYADPKLYRKVEKIVYDGAEVTGSTATVRTTVLYKGEKSAIQYAMLRSGERWRITDMVIDDVSVVRNNRQNFYKEIAKSSYAGLVAKVRKKLAEEGPAGDKASARTY